jgi:hypothetical protein
MLQTALLLSALATRASAPVTPADSPEHLATGAIAEIVSAQAVHRQKFPDVGYACSLERLVETQMLLDVWLEGRRVDGYEFRVWCEKTGTPQATFRASAVPSKPGAGASLTVCTDESNLPRTIDGDVAACFAKGRPAR